MKLWDPDLIQIHIDVQMHFCWRCKSTLSHMYHWILYSGTLQSILIRCEEYLLTFWGEIEINDVRVEKSRSMSMEACGYPCGLIWTLKALLCLCIFHLFFILFCVNYQHLIEPLHVAEVWDREVMRSDSGGFWNWSHLARFKTRAEAVPGFSREGDETAEPDPGRPIKLYKLLGVHGVVAGGAARSVVSWNLLIQVFFAKKPKPLVFISSSVIFIIS